MTERQAERIANIAIGVALTGAAYYILKTPDLRRLAWGLTRNAIAGGAPAWLMAEALRAWNASDASARAPAASSARDMIGG